jgi:phosphatidylglycerophosphatase A
MLTPLPPGLGFGHPAALIATWFGAGLLPRFPGSWGSLAALPYGILILFHGGKGALLAAAVVMFVLGKWAADVYIRHSDNQDPGPVVADEVVGQWLTLLAVSPGAWWEYALAFFLFRVFDVLKPWPVNWAERHFKAGLGVMLDDVFAAIYAFLALWITIYLYHVIFVS